MELVTSLLERISRPLKLWRPSRLEIIIKIILEGIVYRELIKRKKLQTLHEVFTKVNKKLLKEMFAPVLWFHLTFLFKYFTFNSIKELCFCTLLLKTLVKDKNIKIRSKNDLFLLKYILQIFVNFIIYVCRENWTKLKRF